MSETLQQILSHVMGARRYSFVIMNYHDDYWLFDRLRPIVTEVTGFECVRADEIALGRSEDLRGKVHAAIENAALVIAEISHSRPNIFYEVGYAIARQKPVLLLAREGAEIPTDLLGVELIRYSGTREGLELLDKSLRAYSEGT